MSGNQTKKVFSFGSDANGLGNVLFNWSQDSTFIAVTGEHKIVYILDKRGKKIKETNIQGKGKIKGIEWDKDNEILCIMMEECNHIFLWNVFGSNAVTELELDNQKAKVTFIKWSKTHPVLAIGSDKGGILFYNKKNQKSIPTMGKHSKKVITGDWNREGLLITGGEDKILTVSNHNSDTLYESVSVKLDPRKVLWAKPKNDSRDQAEKTITAVLSQKSLLMYELGSKKTPLELVFEQNYGKILDYQLFGDGYFVIAFTEGYVAHISSHLKEIKNEVSSDRVFQSTLDAICTNDVVYKMAVAGENQIKIYNMATWKELKNERIDLPKNAGKVSKLQWSQNGQLLVASTQNGYIFGFLTLIPQLTSTFAQMTAVLSSFTEVQVYDSSKQGNTNALTVVSLSAEPSFINMGPYHIATGINNMVWYYMWIDQKRNGIINGGNLVQKKDYIGSVKQVQINGVWAAVLADGKCILHPIDPQMSQLAEKKFPQSDQEPAIIQIALTREFLITLDISGKISYFHLGDSANILNFKADRQVTKFFNNFSGTKMILSDNKGQCHYFEAANETIKEIISFPTKVDQILWDQKDTNLFAVLENEKLWSYVINKNNIYGVQVVPVKQLLSIEDLQKQDALSVYTDLDRGVKPLSMVDGFLKCFTPSATIQGQYLTSHSFINSYKWEDDAKEGHFRFCLQNLALNQFSNALFAATQLQNSKLYDALGKKALESVDLEVALKSFQLSKNLAMVMTIQSFLQESEKNTIFGNVAMVLGSYDLAQEMFLKSSQPKAAIEMRSDIQDHLLALNLAKNIAPEMEPFICRRLAMQIESIGNENEAKSLYEKAILNESTGGQSTQDTDNHNMLCWAGIARTSIKSGDISKGLSIAKTLRDKNMIIEIAVVCENIKQISEAAELYETAGMVEKSCVLYIQLKKLNKIASLIANVKSNKLLAMYAKLLETEGSLFEAEKYYERAEDWYNVIRINLTEQIDNFEKAILVVRKYPTSTGAQMIATICDQKGLKQEAVEFLIIAGKKTEAFVIAQSYQEMDKYVETLHRIKNYNSEDLLKVASYYEGVGEYEKAADNYLEGNNSQKALQLYFKCGEEMMPKMMELIKNNPTENTLIQTFIGYINGDRGNAPLDPKYLIEVYDVTGNTTASTQISITLSQDKMDTGEYKDAHSILFKTYRKLFKEKKGISYDLDKNLMLLHCYQLVKKVVKAGDHDNAAWLLHKVSTNISQFQTSKINIFTSTVIEATRAKLKPIAYKWAFELIKQENRSQINPKFTDKIVDIARRPVRDPIDPLQNKTECPFCRNMVPEYQLDCTQCQNQIPFCIASGKHIIPQQLTFCPACEFPANKNYLEKLLKIDNNCPMCENKVDPQDLQETGTDGIQQLKSMRQQIKAEDQQQQ